MTLPFGKRVLFVPILLFALWLLTDNETSDSNKTHHLAVFTALRRHPPCLRVYRSLLELNLLLWCAVLSLLLWSRTVGKKMIGHLLFQPAGDLIKNSRFSDATSFRYLPVHGNDIFDEDDAGLERDQVPPSSGTKMISGPCPSCCPVVGGRYATW